MAVAATDAGSARKRLRELREARGLSRARVARDLDTDQSTVLRHELGKTPLSGFHLRAYAHYYGVDPAELGANGRQA